MFSSSCSSHSSERESSSHGDKDAKRAPPGYEIALRDLKREHKAKLNTAKLRKYHRRKLKLQVCI